ncbi:hydrogenase [Deferribacter autotrophicus]|uniref:Hydrogenase n=1 Tax=Deferribacter autotrophicus TaxID=500465 RepID=A0A5A8F2S1_9BACT|nr:hydrogenase [Deferribacter autotrophicus]KAA0258242.1 hydrogenase [Deferribacter autotrophicus]
MNDLANVILSLVLLSLLFCLGSSRLVALVYIMSFQGFVVSLLPLFLSEKITIGNVTFVLLTILIKGILIPIFIYFAVKKVIVKKELEPIIGYHASIFSGLLIIVVSTLISDKFNLPVNHSNLLLLPTAITTISSGIFLLMARRKAITQVIGYLMMENGIYLVGITLTNHNHYIVEFGVLLDILVGIMIMGIILHNINRTFEDVDTNLLRTLKD